MRRKTSLEDLTHAVSNGGCNRRPLVRIRGIKGVFILHNGDHTMDSELCRYYGVKPDGLKLCKPVNWKSGRYSSFFIIDRKQFTPSEPHPRYYVIVGVRPEEIVFTGKYYREKEARIDELRRTRTLEDVQSDYTRIVENRVSEVRAMLDGVISCAVKDLTAAYHDLEVMEILSRIIGLKPSREAATVLQRARARGRVRSAA
jgi:hypothetical protein